MQELRADASIKAADADSTASLAQSIQGEATAAESRAREARLRAWPLSIMVSLKTQRIYVRQGFEPVLEMPIVITEPEKPIGTHAFYATENGQGERGWLAVALKGKTDAAREALDRIDIPREVSEKFASSAWLGSALIVSDEAPYKETAAGTDFIVVLSDEPQGALKLRSPEAEVGSQPVARAPSQRQNVRAYRPPPQDHQFRHPLGFFLD